jgi:hypothetical protein
MGERVGRIIRSAVDLLATIIESAPTKAEREFSRLLSASTPPPEAPRSHIATPPGTSEEQYCLDCASKHLGTAKVLLREALQRAEKGEPRESVLGKVRGAYEELMGAEDDTLAVRDEGIRRLNSLIRDVRKWLFDSGAIVEPDKRLIAEALERVSKVNDEVYREYEARRRRLREYLREARQKIERLEEALSAEPKAA